MGKLIYFKRLACWAQQRFCAEHWTPKATACSLMFWETTIPPIIIFGVKYKNNNNNNNKLYQVDSRRLKNITGIVNRLLRYIEGRGITEINYLIRAGTTYSMW